jgi:hypothetical protein
MLALVRHLVPPANPSPRHAYMLAFSLRSYRSRP